VKYLLRKLTPFSGIMTSVYVVENQFTKKISFKEFLDNNPYHEDKLMNITARIKSIGKVVGNVPGFFRENEGAYRDGVCCLYDEPEEDLRLFCIPINNILIVGGGGHKRVRAWQEDPILNEAGEEMKSVAQLLNIRLQLGILQFSEDGKHLIGDLNL
jgi:hypothetical protein